MSVYSRSSSNTVLCVQHSSIQSVVTKCGNFFLFFEVHDFRIDDSSSAEQCGSTITWVIEGSSKVLTILAPANEAVLLAKKRRDFCSISVAFIFEGSASSVLLEVLW